MLCKQFLKMTMPSLFTSYNYLSPAAETGPRQGSRTPGCAMLTERKLGLCLRLALPACAVWGAVPTDRAPDGDGSEVAPSTCAQKVSEELPCTAKARNHRRFYSIFKKGIKLINRVSLVY